MTDVFKFWISSFSSIISWVFDLVIIDSPRITLGLFLLACAFLGFLIFFFFEANFFLPFISNSSNKATNVVVSVRDKSSDKKD